jgi:hypothetical protein
VRDCSPAGTRPAAAFLKTCNGSDEIESASSRTHAYASATRSAVLVVTSAGPTLYGLYGIAAGAVAGRRERAVLHPLLARDAQPVQFTLTLDHVEGSATSCARN